MRIKTLHFQATPIVDLRDISQEFPSTVQDNMYRSMIIC
jgi:hypothetical protein